MGDGYEKTPETGKGKGKIHEQSGQILTNQQFNQLVNLLEHMQIQGSNNTSNTAQEAAYSFNGGAVNFADSGATHHMTFTKSLLNNFRPLPYPFLITLSNGYKVKVTKIGDACLNPSLTLYNVLFVPSFKFNLISVHCLASHIKRMVSFNNSSCLMQGPLLKSPLEIGRAQNGLYYLCSRCHTSSSVNIHIVSISTTASSSSSSCFPTSSITASTKCNPCNLSHVTSTVNTCNATFVRSTCLSSNTVLYNHVHAANASGLNSPVISHRSSLDHLWHNRLGHIPFVKIKSISNIPIDFSHKQHFT
ncbi:hypothetical protein AABB24_026641 [Solanum stoloniferum]|uniref:Retrovirus-related Pol polyprotein from transposon TNT 1-94-like beta-barrel domain-containing protein n=1 Tax=Solanum stoloniferum TaxID=62892 RepID=A0ABD2SFS0_9SOLN